VASGGNTDLGQAGELRHEAIKLNHAPLFPGYTGLSQAGSWRKLRRKCRYRHYQEKAHAFRDIFKSYEQAWLDDGDFARMTQWLSGIYHKRIETDVSSVKTIDG